MSRLFLWLLVFASQLSFAGEGTPTRVLMYGDSLTAGLGVSKSEAYPALLQKKADEAGLSVQIVNAGVSGDTTAGGLRRLNWNLRQKVDVFVLALGANDGLRGIKHDETRANLKAIIDGVRKKNPEVRILLLGMTLPPNLGAEYVRGFEKIFHELAEQEKIPLMPFLLKDVAAVPELNQADGIHPTAKGHGIMANNVWEHLKLLL